MGRDRRKYTEEFKKDAVDLLRTGEKSGRQLAADLGIDCSMLSRWSREFPEPDDASSDLENEQVTISAKELKKLQRELAIAREERDILKKAVAIFSQKPK